VFERRVQPALLKDFSLELPYFCYFVKSDFITLFNFFTEDKNTPSSFSKLCCISQHNDNQYLNSDHAVVRDNLIGLDLHMIVTCPTIGRDRFTGFTGFPVHKYKM